MFKALAVILMGLCKKKAAILVFPFPCQLHNSLPAVANRISDNPPSAFRLYIGTYYNHQFFQSTRVITAQFPQISLLFHHCLHRLNSTAASTSSSFQFSLLTNYIHIFRRQ
jgi:hypothetical protein